MISLLVFLAGWLYVNFFEYAWHRWVLHGGRNAVHNAHHRAFLSGEYDTRPLLNIWGFVLAVLHVAAVSFFSRPLGLVFGLSVFSYLAVLEGAHAWQHHHPGSRWARWHIEHHRHSRKNFNVFLPVWDFVLGSRS